MWYFERKWFLKEVALLGGMAMLEEIRYLIVGFKVFFDQASFFDHQIAFCSFKLHDSKLFF